MSTTWAFNQKLKETEIKLRELIECNQLTVIDNLTSTSTTDALSANQGRILKDLIDGFTGLETIQRVNTYADLPDPALNTDKYFHVLNSQGTKWLPGSLGGTYYSKGFYYSNGTFWAFVGEVPYQAVQSDVDAGIIPDQFVSPATLKGWWDTRIFTKTMGAVYGANVLFAEHGITEVKSVSLFNPSGDEVSVAVNVIGTTVTIDSNIILTNHVLKIY